MKMFLYAGMVLIVLGIASLVVPIPSSEKEGIKIGDTNIGVQTSHNEKVSPMVSAVLIDAGESPIPLYIAPLNIDRELADSPIQSGKQLNFSPAWFWLDEVGQGNPHHDLVVSEVQQRLFRPREIV